MRQRERERENERERERKSKIEKGSERREREGEVERERDSCCPIVTSSFSSSIYCVIFYWYCTFVQLFFMRADKEFMNK